MEVMLKSYQLDIAMISETHFTRESKMFFEGYCMYNAIHPSNKARGGASILIRKEIKHNLISFVETEQFQAVVVSVHTAMGTFNVAPVYSPPRHNITVENYNNFFNQLGSKFLAGGDWNSKNVKWGSRITTTKGKNLESSVSNLQGDFISPWKPTFYPSNIKHKPDLIDYFIFKNVNFHEKTTCEVSTDFDDDHIPVMLSIFTHPILMDKPPGLVNKSTDWNKFRGLIQGKLGEGPNTSIEKIENIDTEMESIIEIIQTAAKESTKVAVNSGRPLKLPPGLLKLIHSKRTARRKWFETRHESDRSEFNRLNKIVQNRLSKYKNEKFENFIKSLSPKKEHDYSLWKATKYLKRPAQLKLPIRKSDGSWAVSSQDKANLLADHYQKVFQPHEMPDTPQPDRKKRDSKKLPQVRIKKITPSEISAEIKAKTKVRKAPGIDLINGMIIKQLPWLAICKLADIYNAVLKFKYIPKQWKKAEIIVLAKPGKPPEEPQSYRPISLLPALGKLFERLYIKRLKKIVGDKKLIIDSQFGFRDKHSTIEQLHRITSFIDEALENKEFCVGVFLDVAQAFDRVWHEKLIEKLYLMLPCNHVELLTSYLSKRSFRVRFEDAVSQYRPIKAGVPQGSVISPLLYSLFTTDIPEPKRGGKLGIFADDTVALASSPHYEEARSIAQENLNDIYEWTIADKTKLNAPKSVEVVFTNRNYVHVPIVLGGKCIPHAYSTKYLGLTLDAKLRYKEHILKKKKEIILKSRKMYWLLGKNSKLPLHTKTLLYKTMLRPIWSYACQIWGCTANSNLKIIEVVQNKILRTISGARWYQRNADIQRELAVESVEDYIVRIASNYEIRLLNHPNPEAIGLLDWNDKTRRLKRKKPWELTTPGFKKL